jgi:hypothetical protein
MGAQTGRTDPAGLNRSRLVQAPGGVTGLPAGVTSASSLAALSQGRPQTNGPPSETLECAELAARYGCHLSVDQVWRLVALRHRYRADGLTPPRVDARLGFARWLYEQGRISG